MKKVPKGCCSTYLFLGWRETIRARLHGLSGYLAFVNSGKTTSASPKLIQNAVKVSGLGFRV